MTLNPGQRMDMELVAGDESMVAASLVYDKDRVATGRLLETPINLPENPLPNHFNLGQAKRIGLRMEGGAMGRLREAEYQGKKLDIKQLIQEKKIWALNGVAGLSEKPLFSIRRGETVAILIDNSNRWPHAMHVHGHHFRFLDGQGNLHPLWRDTLLINGNEKEQIAFVADNPGKWLIHCHMIEHQAGGMVTWFEVV
jgi:FtsP/CotA-like multicopper oxidase with cupredoxin domain